MLNIGDFARLGQVTPRMLRHYDEIGLLTPDHVDASTGYRSYTTHQLARLHRIVALRDLGFSLGQIGTLLDEVVLDELRGMLRMRQAQIAQAVGEEQARLRRVEAHLRALEGSDIVDVVIKHTQPVRVAAGTAAGLTHADIGPAFDRLLPMVIGHLTSVGATPGIGVAWYEDEGGTTPEGEIVMHAGLDVGDQDVAGTDTVTVTELPVTEVASAVYRGPADGIPAAWETLVRWIEDSGYRLVGDCRELSHAYDDEDPSKNVIELQQPIAPVG